MDLGSMCRLASTYKLHLCACADFHYLPWLKCYLPFQITIYMEPMVIFPLHL